MDDSDISNLKLQKLIYYAQAFHLAIYELPFFDEDFEAWTHGPVCPEIYHKYKHYKSSPIPLTSDFNPELFNPDQLELLNEMLSEATNKSKKSDLKDRIELIEEMVADLG